MISLETTAIFLSCEPSYKTWHSFGICHCAFICTGLLELWGARAEKNKIKKNTCPQWDSNPEPSAYEANTLWNALLYLRIYRLLKSWKVLRQFAILLNPRGRCSKIMHRVFLSYNICIDLGDKRTLFGLFRHVYRGYTVGNGVFLATRQRSQENVSFQQYNHDICAGTIQTVYVYPHSNAFH